MGHLGWICSAPGTRPGPALAFSAIVFTLYPVPILFPSSLFFCTHLGAGAEVLLVQDRSHAHPGKYRHHVKAVAAAILQQEEHIAYCGGVCWAVKKCGGVWKWVEERGRVRRTVTVMYSD